MLIAYDWELSSVPREKPRAFVLISRTAYVNDSGRFRIRAHIPLLAPEMKNTFEICNVIQLDKRHQLRDGTLLESNSRELS